MRIILVMVMVVGALHQRAEACSCQATVFAPPLVPINARIPVLISVPPTGVTLSTADGRAVQATIETVVGGIVVVPSQPLEPDTEYVIADEVGGFNLPFRTRVISDDSAPPAPELGTVTRFSAPVFGDTCSARGETYSVTVADPESAEVVYEVFTGPNVASIHGCPVTRGSSDWRDLARRCERLRAELSRVAEAGARRRDPLARLRGQRV